MIGDWSSDGAVESFIHNSLITIPLAIRRRGGKGIRTPDIQLAKLALYQLSYAPDENSECRLRMVNFKD